MDWVDQKVQACASAAARANLWRFVGELDYSDLMQEFALVFLRVHDREAESETHFMRMFQRGMRWTILQLITYHVGRQRCDCKMLASVLERQASEARVQSGDYTEIVGAGKPDETIRQREVIRLLSEAPPSVRKYLTARMLGEIREREKHETTHAAIRRLTGRRPATVRDEARAWAEAALFEKAGIL